MVAILKRSQLKKARACREQIARFDEYFPQGKVEVTIERAKRLASVFNFRWANWALLDSEAVTVSDQLRRSRIAALLDKQNKLYAEFNQKRRDLVERAFVENTEEGVELERTRRAWDRECILIGRKIDQLHAASWAEAYIGMCKRKSWRETLKRWFK